MENHCATLLKNKIPYITNTKFQQLKEFKQRVFKHVLPTYTTMSKHVFLYYVNKQIFALTESKANTHSHGFPNMQI